MGGIREELQRNTAVLTGFIDIINVMVRNTVVPSLSEFQFKSTHQLKIVPQKLNLELIITQERREEDQHLEVTMEERLMVGS